MALLGGHVSIAGGIDQAPQRGAELGFRAIQVFTANQRRWRAPALSAAAASAFRAARTTCRIDLVASHASYLLNLASPDPQVLAPSLRALGEELARCAALGVDQLVLHPGAHMGAGEDEACARVAASLDRLLAEAPPGAPRVLVEGTAGQGTCVGWRFEHLRAILDRAAHRDRLGVCLDTCHVFAAGYDLRERKSYEATLAQFDRVVGLEHLCAWHVNDSACGLGSRKDRHAHLGEGEIGAAAFRRLARDPRFQRTPFYMETPGAEKHYARNLKVLRGR